MQSFARQLKNRRIWRVLVAYPSVAFVLLEAIEFFITNYGLDVRALTVGLIIAVMLFPAAFIWNWLHGERGHQEFTRFEISSYVVFGVAALAAAGWYLKTAPAPADLPVAALEPVTSVVVLPFENVTGNEELTYLTEGISENLINWLASFPGIRVVSKSAAFRFSGDAFENEALAQEFGADSAIRGSLDTRGDQLVVSASFTHLADDSQLWGERLVRPLDEVIFLERSIVSAIKDSLALRLNDAQGRAAASGSTDSPEAYRRYLRGHHLIQATNIASIEQGIDELREAIRLDPKFGLPYADIADALSQLVFYGILEDPALIGEARNAAYSAVALAPDLPEAHTALATMHQYLTFDWPAVEQAYETAIALSPQLPAPYHRYADYLWVTLRFDKAREMARRAIEIDPLDSSSMHAVGVVELFAGNFDKAAEALGEWNRFHPQSRWSYVKHAVALSLAGRCDESAQQLAKVEQLTGGEMSTLGHSWVGWSHEICGRDDLYQEKKQRIVAAQQQHPDKIDPAYIWFYMTEGEVDMAIDLMRQMSETRHPATMFMQVYMVEFMQTSKFGGVQDDPRYLQLIADLNFPPGD